MQYNSASDNNDTVSQNTAKLTIFELLTFIELVIFRSCNEYLFRRCICLLRYGLPCFTDLLQLSLITETYDEIPILQIIECGHNLTSTEVL